MHVDCVLCSIFWILRFFLALILGHRRTTVRWIKPTCAMHFKTYSSVALESRIMLLNLLKGRISSGLQSYYNGVPNRNSPISTALCRWY